LTLLALKSIIFTMQNALSKADDIWRAAKYCYDARLFDSCANRAYYAMFWAAVAALEGVGLPVERRWNYSELLRLFKKELVKSGIYPAAYTRYLADARKICLQADHQLVQLEPRTVKQILEQAREFIVKVKELNP
jgi:uncharacterized protein (UPF0332 family)